MRSLTRIRIGLVVVVGVLAFGCGGEVGAIPGLADANEEPLVESTPDPSDGSFIWSRAYKVGDLPSINVGHPTPQFWEDAHRDADEAGEWVCLGAGGGAGCGPAVDDPNDPQPNISGIGFGGPDTKAWGWVGVPDQAVAVKFTDQTGATTWQRPADRLVIFPDTIDNKPDDGNARPVASTPSTPTVS